MPVVLWANPAAAQQVPGERERALQVFLDCGVCDIAHVRREITYVNWVRDRVDADLHILGTQQSAGAGGVQYELIFLVRRDFAGRSDTLRAVSDRDQTPDERRARVVHTIRLGLVRYIAATPLASQLRVDFVSAAPDLEQALPARDPWNAWVFTTSLNGSVNGEQRRNSTSLSASLGANRTTEAAKLVVGLRGSYMRDRFTFQLPGADGVSHDTTIVSSQENFDGSLLAAWSVGVHWSAGFKLSGGANSFLNREWVVEGGPAIEYSVFPYHESTRRQLSVVYAVGGYAVAYEEETIFDRTQETLARHTLDVSLRYQQPWGSASASVSGSQFLHDPAKHSASVGGGVSVRVVRGLSLNWNGSLARIKDQIFLPKGALSPDQVLLQRRQLGTDYRFNSSLGFSYTFGSPFSSAVNTRLGI